MARGPFARPRVLAVDARTTDRPRRVESLILFVAPRPRSAAPGAGRPAGDRAADGRSDSSASSARSGFTSTTSDAEEAERLRAFAWYRERTRGPGRRLPPRSRAEPALRREPLARGARSALPAWSRGGCRSCFIEGSEFFAAIESERSGDGRTDRASSLDGPDGRASAGDRGPTPCSARTSPGASCSAAPRPSHSFEASATAAATVLSWLLVGQLIALVVTPGEGIRRGSGHGMSTRLKPRSMRELLVALPRGEHRSRPGRRLQQRRQPLRPSLPGKDDRLDGPLPPDRLTPGGHAQGGLRDDGPPSAIDFLADVGEELYVVPELLLCLPGHRLLRADSRIGRRLLDGGGHDHAGRSLRPGPGPDRLGRAGRRDFARECLQPAIPGRGPAALPARQAEVELLRPPRDADRRDRRRPARRPPRPRGHERRDPPGPCREPQGDGLPVLHGPRRPIRARARSCPATPSAGSGIAWRRTRSPPSSCTP